MIKRLRPKYTDEELAVIYAVPHDHSPFPDHLIRVNRTISMATQLLDPGDRSGADLSCGDGKVLRDLPYLTERHYGDFAPGYEYHGPLERTIYEIPPVDVFVLCETLEHLDDPRSVLLTIRGKAKKLVFSTVLNETNDENPEHYWGWDRAGMAELFEEAEWKPQLYVETELHHGWYQFQIWGCT